MADRLVQRMRALAQVVADNYASALLTDAERNPARIMRPDIPWSLPPLRTHTKLDGTPIMSYLTPDCDVDADALYAFWVHNLKTLWEAPTSALRRGLYINLSKVMPGARAGTLAMAFSVPVGWPYKVHESAGITLSLEVAHLAISCLGDLELVVDDEDNYYVVLPDGRELGVKNGHPAVESHWLDYQPLGMVTDLTETMRGDAVVDCQYDQLAAIRSVMWEHDRMFPQFEALDMAMQALRVMSFGSRCPSLSASGRQQIGRVEQLRNEEVALRDAIDVMEANMSDRRKLECLYQLLVPTVLSQTGFRKHIFASPTFPYTMTASRPDKIRAVLYDLYEKIPCSLKPNP